MAFARNFTKSPYSDDEKRIVNWLVRLSPDIGGGDDPIGFFMSSYEYVIHERKELKRQIAALKIENERLTKIRSFDEPGERDLAQDSIDIANEYVRRGKAAQAAVDEIIKKVKK